MSERPPRPLFALVPLAELHAHEAIDERDLPSLVREIRSTGVLRHPIWVAVGSHVILNGHHRAAALRQLGAVRAPVWLFDYHGPSIHVDRWTPGPTISKEEVEQRGLEGRLFPPKTTKHTIALDLEERPTRLAELLDRPAGAHPRVAAASSAGDGTGR